MKTKIQACIIDDEKHGRDYIALLIQRNSLNLKLSFRHPVLRIPTKAFEKYSGYHFLDIQLKEGTASISC
ncbi:hypothetical protein EJ377_19520 [Chryseobacterium arthrosphaerae]|uniref:Uncharacterized protein n=1 Tax=Chryseobacterium arthrosphaerae TaxID=651561 RepID=A0A432DTM3_9FLAO|nr:hypothetical protein EJ377_19520 [Chryseobacterium arthrosphaerae]